MRVFIGCEESGVVRRAFESAGHFAVSCDLEPARDNSQNHIQADVVATLESYSDGYWDLIILHPDCTKVAVCGNRHWAGTSERAQQISWILGLWELAKRKGKSVALENPASVIWPRLRKAGASVQFIHPHQFGHPEQKKTGLALHRLPPLIGTRDVRGIMQDLPVSERERIFRMAPSLTRKRDRSETYAGIAAAVAAQWARDIPTHQN